MFVLRLLSRLSFRILYLLSDFLFFVSYRVIRYRRKLVRKNLISAFPEKPFYEVKVIEKEFYKALCDYAVETLKTITITKQTIRERVVFKNTESVKALLTNGQSVIFLTSHIFNWEWLLLGGCLEYPGQMDFIYQSVGSNFFNTFSLAGRTRFGAVAIERHDVAKVVFKRRNEVRAIALLADQYPGYGPDKKYEVKFLNQETVFFFGANQLTQLTQYPTFYHTVRRVGRGRYEAEIKEIARPPYAKNSNAVIENYVQMMEQNIRENPSNWLWSHDRWKTRHLNQASARYPRATDAS